MPLFGFPGLAVISSRNASVERISDLAGLQPFGRFIAELLSADVPCLLVEELSL